MEFFKVDKLNEAREKIYNTSIGSFSIEKESVDILDSIDRVSSENVIANDNVPTFRRSTVDGYAVMSSDVQNVSESAPTFLNVIGESKMGENLDIDIKSGECIYVPTGGMIPKSSDSVVMIEYVESFNDKKIAVYKSVSTLENVINVGDDNKKDEVLIKKGKKITSSDIGLLASNGISKIDVYKTFKISIISTGDEIVGINEKKDTWKVRDVNTYTLYSLCKKYGFNVIDKKLIIDDKDLIKETVIEAMKISDIVVLSGGSSKGKKDNTKDIIDEVCSSKSIIRGIAVKPGKPTIVGYDDVTKTFVYGLPGHPVACMILFKLLIKDLYNNLTGCIDVEKPYTKGVMKENVVQSPGRKTFQLVNVDKDNNIYPIYGKSSFISVMSKADGYIVIDENSEGVNIGEMVDVWNI